MLMGLLQCDDVPFRQQLLTLFFCSFLTLPSFVMPLWQCPVADIKHQLPQSSARGAFGALVGPLTLAVVGVGQHAGNVHADLQEAAGAVQAL